MCAASKSGTAAKVGLYRCKRMAKYEDVGIFVSVNSQRAFGSREEGDKED